MISAVIASNCESEILKYCLSSIYGFADEIIVFNTGGSDTKLENLVQKYNLTEFKHKKVPYIELMRNEMITEASGDWILILDPDEQLPEKLKNLLKIISSEDKFDAVNIPRKNIIFGKWIKHTNWWPDKQIRFFKKGKLRWMNKIHSYPVCKGNLFQVPSKEDLAIVHYQYKDIFEFIQKQNRYSSAEALNLYEKGEKSSLVNLFWWPLRQFLTRFIKHGGFFDGFYGLVLTYLMMIYKISVWVKLWQWQNIKKIF